MSEPKLLKHRRIRTIDTALISLISVIMSIVVGAVIITLLGYNPFLAYSALLKGALGSFVSLTATIRVSVPLIFSGLAVAFAYRCNVFNIGVEGQFLFGAFFSVLAGLFFKLPSVLHLIVCLTAGMIGGMLFSLIPAVLKSKLNVDIVISCIMFNYIGKYVVQYFIMNPLHGNTSAQATNTIAETARLPALLPRPYQMNLGFLIMFLTVVFVYVFLNKTTLGFEMTAVGKNALAAEMQGINAKHKMFLGLLISGAIAGLGGSIEVTGTLFKFINGFSTGYGFAGIPIALMAQCNPFAILASGFFFGIMRSGSFMMQSAAGVSSDMVGIIQGLVVIFICLENMIRYYIFGKRC